MTDGLISASRGRCQGRPDEVVTCDQAEPWTFGAGALMANLARRGLLAARTAR